MGRLLTSTLLFHRASSVEALPVPDGQALINNGAGHPLVARSDLELNGNTLLQAAKRGTDTDLITRRLDHDGGLREFILARDTSESRDDLIARNGLTEFLMGLWKSNKNPETLTLRKGDTSLEELSPKFGGSVKSPEALPDDESRTVQSQSGTLHGAGQVQPEGAVAWNAYTQKNREDIREHLRRYSLKE